MRNTLPTLRELHQTGGAPSRRPAPRSRVAYLDDPDLAPAPRKETPLSCWA